MAAKLSAELAVGRIEKLGSKCGSVHSEISGANIERFKIACPSRDSRGQVQRLDGRHESLQPALSWFIFFAARIRAADSRAQ